MRFVYKKIVFLICVSSLLVFSGCFSPLKKLKGATDNINKTETKIDGKKDELSEKSKNYVYGADFSLSLDPTPNKFSSVAKDFTERSLLITGNPSTQEAMALKELVKELLSTNATIQAEGERKLKIKDNEVAGLQIKITELEKDKTFFEEKYKKISEENSILGQKWFNLWKWIKIIGFVLLGGFILNVISMALPPPYNSIAAIVSLPVGLFVKLIHGLIPSAKSFAGVVSQKVHDESSDTLERLVASIQHIKTHSPGTFTNELEPVLKDFTDKGTSRDVINNVKKKLKFS